MHNYSQTYIYNGIEMRNECYIYGGTCYMKLTMGKWCKIDVKDMDLVGKHRWSSHKSRYNYYARGTDRISRKLIYMHALLANTPKGMSTDHINRNGLDNRKRNLRVITISLNCMNIPSRENSTSIYLGVSRHENKRWTACIQVNGRKKHLGCFQSEEDARDVRAIEFCKEFGYDINPDQGKIAKEAKILNAMER